MFHRNYPTRSHLRCFIQIQLLYQSIFWLSGLILLNGGSAIAQSTTDDVNIPVPSSPQPTIESTPITPSVPVETPLPSSEPIQPTTPSDIPIQFNNTSKTSDSYIDSTPYNIGATTRSDPSTPTVPRDHGLSVASPDQLSRRAINAPTISYPAVAYSGGTTASGQRYLRSFRLPINRNIGNIRLVFPLSLQAPITSLFVWRVHPISCVLRFHSGTDIGAPLGTPVLAAYAGRVVIADFLSGYGLSVALQHQKNTQETLYAHLSEVFVQPGQWVKQGDVIGRVGSTGTATGPNLHFELRQLTAEGWVATDANASLEYALVEFTKALQSTPVANKTISTQTKPRSDQQPRPVNWSAMDAGTRLEYLLSQLMNTLQVDQPVSPTQS
ncbi:MAG: peptidoglycan DD-metalloendopeptidase family protein [Leptolyngbyaceae cyanobacterium bins.302]|nr:peptidoglycan DD-metalloendopeptidase family protein [Leptolyngbyaceae cyanobacterium bins.302]